MGSSRTPRGVLSKEPPRTLIKQMLLPRWYTDRVQWEFADVLMYLKNRELYQAHAALSRCHRGPNQMYLTGVAFSMQDEHESAREFFKQAAMGELDIAEYRYAMILSNEGNLELSAAFLESAATKGVAEAMYEFSCVLRHGLGVMVDMPQAVGLLMRAASAGYDLAQLDLGMCYEFGHGIVKDMNKAAIYYQLASDQGNAVAANMIGLCYFSGLGVKKNLLTAESMFRRAVDGGNHSAILNLANCTGDKHLKMKAAAHGIAVIEQDKCCCIQ